MCVIKPEEQIKSKALALGFEGCGITSCKTFDKESRALDAWLNNHYHAEMEFMRRNREKRENPSLLHPETKSVVVVLLNYGNPAYISQKKSSYQFAEYALGKDYHVVLKDKLQQLSDFITALSPSADNRCFVDTAPLFEKSFAVEAGLGWIGKNTLLITPQGSTFFIGEIFTTLSLTPDLPFKGQDCAHCNKCVNSCPTNALGTPYVLNANKCLSYHSIERKQTAWDATIEKQVNHYIYGCDICQQVCPYNVNRKQTAVAKFKIKPEILHFADADWENISEETFHSIFADSAAKRIGYQKFKENISVTKERKKLRD